MKRVIKGINVFPGLCLISLAFTIGCGESPVIFYPSLEEFAPIFAVDAAAGGSKEVASAEDFDEKREVVKFFLGQFKDFPDPIIDPNAPLRIPTQADVESLFKYVRKYLDTLEAQGPDPEIIKRKLFINENGRLELNSLLDKFRLKPIFKDVSFSIEGVTFNRAQGVPGTKPVRYTSMFKNVVLKNAKFNSVNLDDVDFSGSELTDVDVSNSSFIQALCQRCKFNNVNFTNSTSRDADFSFSSGNLSFTNSNNSFLKITDSNFDKLSFDRGTLRQSVFINSGPIDITNVKTFNNIDDGTTAELDFKKIGLVFKNSFPGGTANKIYDKIRSLDHLPVRIEYGLEGFFNENAIQKEVESILANVATREDDLSIAQKFIQFYRNNKSQFPELEALEIMTKNYVDKLDALVIPGGLDIEPYWYDKNISAEKFYQGLRDNLKEQKKIESEQFPLRSILELFLIDLSKQKHIPLLLICRGAHIYNVYNKGKMIENLPDTFANIDLENHLRFVTEAPDLSYQDGAHRIIELFRKEGGKPAAVYGNHHQAIDKNAPGAGLRTLLVWNLPDKAYMPYALYDNTYRPGAWLFQFHPEVKEEMGDEMSNQLSNLNSEIFDSFFELIPYREEKAKEMGVSQQPVISTTPMVLSQKLVECVRRPVAKRLVPTVTSPEPCYYYSPQEYTVTMPAPSYYVPPVYIYSIPVW